MVFNLNTKFVEITIMKTMSLMKTIKLLTLTFYLFAISAIQAQGANENSMVSVKGVSKNRDELKKEINQKILTLIKHFKE